MTTLVHLSDIHFGRDVDLLQVGVLETLIPTLAPAAIVVSGDLTHRSRHGELQAALAFVGVLRRVAPTFVIPGNHDVLWWESPFRLFGTRPLYAKYRHYFGSVLAPSLRLPGIAMESTLTSHGAALGSLTWKFWRDMAVKGHLPAAEVERVTAAFGAAPPDHLRVLVLHHNVLRGQISRRMGLARWRAAQDAVVSTGADLVLCGHDHQELIASLGDVVISTASSHTSRTRGGRPSAFNVVEVTGTEIAVRHHVWDRAALVFYPTEPVRFVRRSR